MSYFPTLELSTWAAVQVEHRQHYTKLRQKYIEEPAEMIQQSNNNQDLTDNNPLALNDNVKIYRYKLIQPLLIIFLTYSILMIYFFFYLESLAAVF